MEEQVVYQKLYEILDNQHISDSMVLDKEPLYSYMPSHSFIRIIGPNSNIISQVTNDQKLYTRIKPKFTLQKESELKHFTEDQNIVVRVPIISKQKVIGTLEFGERLSGLEFRKDFLLSIMATVTGISIILSLLAGRWLTKIIMKPIASMIFTMEEIEQSGVPKKILINNDTKDELKLMAETFNKMIVKLQRNIDKQRQFISDASHELKTPITVINSFSELLLRRGVENKEITKEALEAINSEGIRMEHLIHTLLQLAKSEQPEDIEMESVNLTALCTSIQSQFQKVYKRKIILHEPPSHIFIRGHELQLKQVIIIFLDNALKYSDAHIDFFLESRNHEVIIQIRDYGIGIPQEELDNIFERFYRVDKARNRKTGGTGLGLPIAKNIVSLHNGEINIKSEENKGTVIILTFPLLKPEMEI